MAISRNHNDIILFRELGKDSQEAFLRIYMLYFSRLTEASFRVCADRQLAKEIALDSLHALWHNRIKVSGKENPPGWLLKCVKNKSLNALKSLKRRRTRSLREDQDMPGPEYIQQNLEASEYRKLVNKAIEKLAPKQKKIIELVLDGFSRKEIAKQFNLAESTIKKQVYNAYKNLRKTMESYPRD